MTGWFFLFSFHEIVAVTFDAVLGALVFGAR